MTLTSSKFSIGLNWSQLLSRAINCEPDGTTRKKFSLQTQRYLVFMVRLPRLYFLHRDLDLKKIFIWSQLTPIGSMILHGTQWCLIDKICFTQKLKDILYLCWGSLISTSYVKIFASKNFCLTSIVPIVFKGHQLWARRYNSKKIFAQKLKDTLYLGWGKLIFTSYVKILA